MTRLQMRIQSKATAASSIFLSMGITWEIILDHKTCAVTCIFCSFSGRCFREAFALSLLWQYSKTLSMFFDYTLYRPLNTDYWGCWRMIKLNGSMELVVFSIQSDSTIIALNIFHPFLLILIFPRSSTGTRSRM